MIHNPKVAVRSRPPLPIINNLRFVLLRLQVLTDPNSHYNNSQQQDSSCVQRSGALGSADQADREGEEQDDERG